MALLTADVAGKTLAGRYHVIELDHEELLGAVYTARDTQNGALVSLKVLHPHLTEDTERFRRFGREITATYMVSQKNTVEVFDWGEEDEIHYLVMEYLCAHSLETELKEGPLHWSRVAAIGAQIARAIGAAHQEGVVHRALSPENILLLQNTRDGDFVKVRDFGLSKLEKVEGDEDTGLTTQGTRVGTTAYMAPEYIESSTYHTKSDLYALGALMVEMLTGKPPFNGNTLHVLSAHLETAPKAPSARVPEVPDWMDALVLDMLNKKAEERPGAYKVVQRLQTGTGETLDVPELRPLDADGQIVPEDSPAPIVVALGVILLIVVLCALAFGALMALAAGFIALSQGL